ncbi:DUF6115 domain-containing protein [Clostridiisalibacter paucivorans]|uniref:DUF6115 domain-containing protein n=1 Tax=Clostridiisalibacter paucivorans TaxID=408753 RepID=UPI00047ACCCC|nr:hypothetical protein [Clostridiisalibacter paucivorans]
MITFLLIFGIIIVIFSIIFLIIENQKQNLKVQDITAEENNLMLQLENMNKKISKFENILDNRASIEYEKNNLINNNTSFDKEYKNIEKEEQVYNLYEKGYSIQDIAKELDRGIREIEIIIKMKYSEIRQ